MLSLVSFVFFRYIDIVPFKPRKILGIRLKCVPTMYMNLINSTSSYSCRFQSCLDVRVYIFIDLIAVMIKRQKRDKDHTFCMFHLIVSISTNISSGYGMLSPLIFISREYSTTCDSFIII